MELTLSPERWLDIRGERKVRGGLEGGQDPSDELREEQDRDIANAVKSAVDRARSVLSSRYEGRSVDLALNPALEQSLSELAHGILLANLSTGVAENVTTMTDRNLRHMKSIAAGQENLSFDEPKTADRNRRQMLMSQRDTPSKFGPGSGFMEYRR